MLLLRLARSSLGSRLLPSALTVASIAFSVALLVGVENIRHGLRDSFTGTISGTDLIIGPRSGSTQLLLYTVFGFGSPTGNLSWESYEYFRDHPAVAWTIPISLGDNHRGYRVVGTTEAFYEHFRFREGRSITLAEGRVPATDHEVAVGSEVAERLRYRVGDEVVVTHGMGAAGIMDHEEAPFVVTGVLARTGTPVDRALYVTLEGIEAMHEGWIGGAIPPLPSFAPVEAGAEPTAGDLHGHVHGEPHSEFHGEPEQITAFLLGTTSRFAMLALQREVNDYRTEALTAVIPGIALAELWRTVGYAEEGLRLVSILVVIVGLLGMVVSLYTALDSRRREMAILRAVGAGPGRILGLLVLESGVLAAAGALGGVALVYGGIALFRGAVEDRFGLLIPLRPLGGVEWGYLMAVLVAGIVVGFIPALRAYRATLSDGLSPKS